MAIDLPNWDAFLDNAGVASCFEILDEQPKSQEPSKPTTLEAISAESDRQRELAEQKRLQEEEAKRQRKRELANKRKEVAQTQALASLRQQNGESLVQIIHAVRQGQPIPFLFLLAVKALAQTLNQSNVGDQIEEEFLTVYGIGLEDSSIMALQIEDLKDTQARLETFLEANSQTLKGDEKKRLQNAIQEKEKEIERLEILQMYS